MKKKIILLVTFMLLAMSTKAQEYSLKQIKLHVFSYKQTSQTLPVSY